MQVIIALLALCMIAWTVNFIGNIIYHAKGGLI